MADLICPYSAPLAQEARQCTYAQKIIRRGGEEIACDNTTLHTSCKAVLDHCKQAALAEMGMEDDLLTVPHGTLVKIQFGTLIGLQQTLDNEAMNGPADEDIPDLIARAVTHYSTIGEIPTVETTRASMEYRLQRRRRK